MRPTIVTSHYWYTAYGFIFIVGSLTPAAAGQPVADFDWSMPDRFGLDARSMSGAAGPDGVLDYVVTLPGTWEEIDPVHGSPAVNPPTWRVDFDARSSTGAIATYRWSVDGEVVAELPGARYSHFFPAEGRYRVSLTVTGAGGASASTEHEVTVQDWLIVALGDSYASGEGVPEPTQSPWIDDLGEALAALESARADLASAAERMRQARIHLELTQAEVGPALDALNNWNGSCQRPVSIACATATARLATELVRLGFSEAQQLIERGFQYIRSQVLNLVDAAQAAFDAAQAAFNATQATVDGLQETVDRIRNQTATWQTLPASVAPGDRDCHRSSRSGQARAALELERSDPRTSVTFVQVSCSGGRIVEEENSSSLLDDQLPVVAELVGDREIDALVMSIGGNDVGLVGVGMAMATNSAGCDAAEAAVQAVCVELGIPPQISSLVASEARNSCEEFAESRDLEGRPAAEVIAAGLAKVRNEDRYAQLDGAFASLLPQLPAGRVYITEYPSLAWRGPGAICPTLATISEEDWRTIDGGIADLNDLVREAAGEHSWNFVGGVNSEFVSHGFCAPEHWFVRPGESFVNQADLMGTIHPNAEGHLVYGSQIRASLAGDFYPAGPSGTPRLPAFGPSFRRGDSNGDGVFNIADALAVLGYLFMGNEAPGCLEAADANASRSLDITDPLHLLNHLFLGGAAPPAPYPACGSVSEPVLGCDAPPTTCS
jgi:PKD repeat protein